MSKNGNSPEGGFDVFDQIEKKARTVQVNGDSISLRMPSREDRMAIRAIQARMKDLKDEDAQSIFEELSATCLSSTVCGARKRTIEEWMDVIHLANVSPKETGLADLLVESLTLCGFESSARAMSELRDNGKVQDHVKELEEGIGDVPTR